ncbi:porin [Paraburkholderia sp. JHI869]|uniref:porin n=1 Tax=Paraburkholderia sp. JHI869 TaxID=3112959 RepID=UPI00316B20A2
MKRIALIALIAAPVFAHAQSNVTLYGRLDDGLAYINGVSNGEGGSTHRFSAESGYMQTSLLGFWGTEDLGGGNKALFHLEGGFNAMNGSAGLFSRWATVGLSNDSYGTLVLGRQLFISNGVWSLDPFGQAIWGSASLVRGRNWPGSSNTVAYQSPQLAGFDLYGQYALSNATNWNGNGTTDQGRQAGLQVTYSSAHVVARMIYDEVRNPQNGLFDNVFSYSREYTAGVNVLVGELKFQGTFQAIRTSNVTAAAMGTPTSLDHEWGGVTWQASPAATVIGAVYHVNGNNGAGNATIFSVGGTYSLSKRTMLELQAATIRNSKTANFGLMPDAPGPGGPYNDNPLPGGSQSGIYAAINHSF